MMGYTGYFLRIDCGKAEEGLKTTLCSECTLNALSIDEPLEYARLYLVGYMQMWRSLWNYGKTLKFLISIRLHLVDSKSALTSKRNRQC